ncbi:MAG: c-type cytochrome [Burkholderiaceae bacterium]|nr:c-type cytochrome [Burkholderiaceae bacterium]
MIRSIRTGLALTGLAALAAGPAAAQTLPAPPAGASAQVVQGGQLYAQHCALCHGANGRDATVFPRPIWGAGAVTAYMLARNGSLAPAGTLPAGGDATPIK